MADSGTNMGDAEWARTAEVRAALAALVGERAWSYGLTDDEADEAVRREAGEPGSGEAYARDCLRTRTSTASGAGGRGGA